ncbi:hypothetical protein EYF80_065770 [Liparis tanakae]|uniref:Uncharacterized protein n=1 Tax=Liparis tanakae TaxID=230148 RepID=A0A4Z2E5V2_9TELE|nr:hypothetical protein EYF80_065770 [Liparis tanakae]
MRKRGRKEGGKEGGKMGEQGERDLQRPQGPEGALLDAADVVLVQLTGSREQNQFSQSVSRQTCLAPPPCGGLR